MSYLINNIGKTKLPIKIRGYKCLLSKPMNCALTSGFKISYKKRVVVNFHYAGYFDTVQVISYNKDYE